MDLTGSTVTPGRTNTEISTAATFDIVATPGGSTTRNVKTINIRNTDLGTSNIVEVVFNANGTLISLYRGTLMADSQLTYVEGVGWDLNTTGANYNGTVSEWPAMARSTALSAMTAAHFNTAATRTTATAIVFPMAVREFVTGNMMRVPIQMSYTSATTTANWSFTVGQTLAIYTKNANTLSLLSSFSNQQVLSYTSSTASTVATGSWAMSYGSGTALSSSTSLSTNNAGNTSLWTSISNTKLHPFATGAFSLSPGEYFGLYAFSTATGGANLGSITQIGIDAAGSNTQQMVGLAVASTTGLYPLLGAVSFTQTNTAAPASIAVSDISTASNNASWVNRIPALQMLSIP